MSVDMNRKENCSLPTFLCTVYPPNPYFHPFLDRRKRSQREDICVARPQRRYRQSPGLTTSGTLFRMRLLSAEPPLYFSALQLSANMSGRF
jgi:hypothetical protein